MKKNMINFPLVSVIVISYNQKPYIDDCMQGLLNLSYPNIELLYLDDCSPDGSFDKACQYEESIRKKFERVSFIGNTVNQGLIKNLNSLVMQCHGKYVKFIAADDFLLSESIDQMVAFMELNSEYDLIYSNAWYGDAETHFLFDTSKLSPIYTELQPNGRYLFEQLYRNDFIAAPTVMVKRELYERVGLYDPNLEIEDWDFFLRVARQGSIGYLDEETVVYRYTEGSLSHSDHPLRRINMQRSGLLIQEKYKELVSDSREIMTKSYNEAYQDALHINNAEYFKFLDEFSRREQLHLSLKNKLRTLLYKLRIFEMMEKFR